MSLFVLDANIFIEAYRRYYSFDIAPFFWVALKQKAEAGLLISIDKIYQEISKYDDTDELKIWAKNEFRRFFISTDDAAVLDSYKDIMQWAMAQPQFTAAAKAEFAQVADSWLVALAAAKNYTLVTHEEYIPDIKRRIPIPNVCYAYGVPCINTFEMLRKLGIKLG